MKSPFDDQITAAIDAGKDHKSVFYFYVIETEIGGRVSLMVQKTTFQELDNFDFSKLKRMSSKTPIFSL